MLHALTTHRISSHPFKLLRPFHPQPRFCSRRPPFSITRCSPSGPHSLLTSSTKIRTVYRRLTSPIRESMRAEFLSNIHVLEPLNQPETFWSRKRAERSWNSNRNMKYVHTSQQADYHHRNASSRLTVSSTPNKNQWYYGFMHALMSCNLESGS